MKSCIGILLTVAALPHFCWANPAIPEESKQIPRKVLCLFGTNTRQSEDHPLWPEDTLTAILLQSALEWMGYEVEYHDASKGLPKSFDMGQFCGIILDEKLDIPTEQEHAYLDWLLQQKQESRKLLFLGNYVFENPRDRARLLQSLGIRGDFSRKLVRTTPKIVVHDKTVVVQTLPVRPVFAGFSDLSAPKGSTVFLGLELDGQGEGRNPRFDVIFATGWGGAVLSPYGLCVASESIAVAYIDPFAFLKSIFPPDAFPAPDVTTKDGLRIFYSHVDGDGFSSLSSVSNGKTCAEVLYDEVLRDLPTPITVSVIEAELLGQMPAQKPEDRERMEAIARKIFQLPQVEPASHSYSHPFVWDLRDGSNLSLYPSLYLPLKPGAAYDKLDLRREIVGSLDYIRKTLAPSDRPPRLILWSGNCRPSTEALQLAKEAGVENMNGGKTILCKRFPGITGVAPKGVSLEGVMQIFASNQNEFYYTNGWKGPYYSGFKQVIETFEMTDAERRLKPVNLYYHFFSADRPAALESLKEIYRWCQQRPMRAMTASEYAEIVRDSHATAIWRTGAASWEFRNTGKHTVYRFPSRFGFPDLEKSSGVIGFREERGQLYVQTDGSPQVRLFLCSQKPNLPYLRSSTASIHFSRLGSSGALIETRKWPANVEVGGFLSGRSISVCVESKESPVAADSEGVLRVTLPAGIRCSVTL